MIRTLLPVYHPDVTPKVRVADPPQVSFGNRLKAATQTAGIDKMDRSQVLDLWQENIANAAHCAPVMQAAEARIATLIRQGDSFDSSACLTSMGRRLIGLGETYQPSVEVVSALENAWGFSQYVDPQATTRQRLLDTLAMYYMDFDYGMPQFATLWYTNGKDFHFGKHDERPNRLRFLEDAMVKLIKKDPSFSNYHVGQAVSTFGKLMDSGTPGFAPSESLLSKLEEHYGMASYVDPQATSLQRLEDMKAYSYYQLGIALENPVELARILVKEGDSMEQGAHQNRPNRKRMLEDSILKLLQEDSPAQYKGSSAKVVISILNDANYDPQNAALTDRLIALSES